MASPYIPPHHRGKTQPGESAVPAPGVEASDVEAGIQKSDAGLPGTTESDQFHSLREIQHFYWPDRDGFSNESTTLHASGANPGVLNHVLLFNNSNPRWAQENTIFVKSKLHLLSPELAAHRTSSNNDGPLETKNLKTIVAPTKGNGDAPIAVFYQIGHSKRFKFDGWYRVVKIDLLQPHSNDLESMLDEKWSFFKFHGRSEHQKNNYFREGSKKMWAVATFEKDEEANKELQAPAIPEIGVVEMSRLLRLRDEKSKKSIQEAVRGAQDVAKDVPCESLKTSLDIFQDNQERLQDILVTLKDIRELLKGGLKFAVADKVEKDLSA